MNLPGIIKLSRNDQDVREVHTYKRGSSRIHLRVLSRVHWLASIEEYYCPHKHNVAGSQVINNEPTTAGLLRPRLEAAFGLWFALICRLKDDFSRWETSIRLLLRIREKRMIHTYKKCYSNVNPVSRHATNASNFPPEWVQRNQLISWEKWCLLPGLQLILTTIIFGQYITFSPKITTQKHTKTEQTHL